MLQFTLQRSLTYFLFQAFAPSILLMVLNLSSYYVPAAAAPARVTLIVTSFLTSTFILKAATERTVKLSFMNPMQLFLTVNIMFIVASMVQYIIVLTTSRRMKVSMELNRVCQKQNTWCGILDFFIDKKDDLFLQKSCSGYLFSGVTVRRCSTK